MIYKTSEQLRTELLAQGFNTVTFGDNSEVDLNRKNVYPLAHIEPRSVIFKRGVAVTTYIVQVFDIPDVENDPDIAKSPFKRSDLVEDILNDLAQRVNIIWQRIKRNNDMFYTDQEDLTLNTLLFVEQQTLCGYEFTLTYKTDNVDGSSC